MKITINSADFTRAWSVARAAKRGDMGWSDPHMLLLNGNLWFQLYYGTVLMQLPAVAVEPPQRGSYCWQLEGFKRIAKLLRCCAAATATLELDDTVQTPFGGPLSNTGATAFRFQSGALRAVIPAYLQDNYNLRVPYLEDSTELHPVTPELREAAQFANLRGNLGFVWQDSSGQLVAANPYAMYMRYPQRAFDPATALRFLASLLKAAPVGATIVRNEGYQGVRFDKPDAPDAAAHVFCEMPSIPKDFLENFQHTRQQFATALAADNRAVAGCLTSWLARACANVQDLCSKKYDQDYALVRIGNGKLLAGKLTIDSRDLHHCGWDIVQELECPTAGPTVGFCADPANFMPALAILGGTVNIASDASNFVYFSDADNERAVVVCTYNLAAMTTLVDPKTKERIPGRTPLQIIDQVVGANA